MITGGGGGVTAEPMPHGAQKQLTRNMCRDIPRHLERCPAWRNTDGNDDAYGFMDPRAFRGFLALRQSLPASGPPGEVNW